MCDRLALATLAAVEVPAHLEVLAVPCSHEAGEVGKPCCVHHGVAACVVLDVAGGVCCRVAGLRARSRLVSPMDVCSQPRWCRVEHGRKRAYTRPRRRASTECSALSIRTNKHARPRHMCGAATVSQTHAPPSPRQCRNRCNQDPPS